MAATPSYFLLVLPHSNQEESTAKERDHSELLGNGWVTPVSVAPLESTPVYSGRVCNLSAITGGSVGQDSGFSRCQRSDLVEKSLVMCKSRIEGPGISYKLTKVLYILWLTTGALVSLSLCFFLN